MIALHGACVTLFHPERQTYHFIITWFYTIQVEHLHNIYAINKKCLVHYFLFMGIPIDLRHGDSVTLYPVKNPGDHRLLRISREIFNPFKYLAS